MKLNKKTAHLVAQLENIIGSSCYNPNSYNGYTGEYGKEFKYPVWATTRYGSDEKYQYGIDSALRRKQIKQEDVDSMFYKFGSNHLHIGEAIVKVLEYLEREYNLDFEELTAKADPTRKYRDSPQIDVLRKAVSMIEGQKFEYNAYVKDGVTGKTHGYTHTHLFPKESLINLLSEEFYMPKVFRGLKKSKVHMEDDVCWEVSLYHVNECNHQAGESYCYSEEVNDFVELWGDYLIPKILSGSIKESDLDKVMKDLNRGEYSTIYWWKG